MNESYTEAEENRGRIKPILGRETVSFDVISITKVTAVLEFVFEGEAKAFFDGLLEAGYEGPCGRLRIIGLHANNCFEVGTPSHIYADDFNAVTWSPTADPSDGVVLDGMPG